ncbi:LuxR C-terminal-related transcriptional regulator [Caldimonas caldifontis]|jgi:PAS domain S-box-containing protein|uniref:Helix-turn-helix transcriptional regulator n=1 Tax=Caldimonas caldifontis TaxID=1452508 RepID=A0A2S5STL0_9BURK|nr:LuxR C-terminal-related transcriptional regulator [Caldimonas caldifontis]PPE66072.1 helix-turn-helix transcriptional regulator [Caldimonas caldifontis]
MPVDLPALGALDYRAAFEMAPVGLVLSRNRVIVDCNHALAEMFCTSREVLVGQSFLVLYPSPDEFERTGERIAPILGHSGRYADERIMKRSPGDPRGELFWCHVTGRALHRDTPHAAGIWTFEDLSSKRPVTLDLTGREREVAALLIEGQTSKQIGKALGVSHRTVDIYRARLLRKYRASTTPELVQRLMGG